MEEFICKEKSIEQEIRIHELNDKNISLFVKRDDLLHPIVSGNKWRKLKYNIEQAKSLKNEGLFTFGGAYSNHIVATAAACKMAGLKSIAYVRGEELTIDSNSTLQTCHELGMELKFLSREYYTLRNDKQFVDELRMEHPFYYPVPEGGANFYGMIGCQEINSELECVYDAIFVACGTGTTAAGLLLGLQDDCQLHVIPVLKGFDTLETLSNLLKWSIFDDELTNELLEKVHVYEDFHAGGYGKVSPEILEFIDSMKINYQLPLDKIYTAKAFKGMLEVLTRDDSFVGKRILFLHTGGLQGN
jgi:1-aminocyclopropane-1-carboxylate deaminase